MTQVRDLQQNRQHVAKSVHFAQTPRRLQLLQVTILCSNAMQYEEKPPVLWCTSHPCKSQPANDTAAERSLIYPTSPPSPALAFCFTSGHCILCTVTFKVQFNSSMCVRARRSLGLAVFETHMRQYAKNSSGVRMTTTVH